MSQPLLEELKNKARKTSVKNVKSTTVFRCDEWMKGYLVESRGKLVGLRAEALRFTLSKHRQINLPVRELIMEYKNIVFHRGGGGGRGEEREKT